MYEIILNILDNFNFENCGRILNATLPYFSWQLAFYRHLPTSGRQNKVKKILPPLSEIFRILSAKGFREYLPEKNFC